MALTRKFLSALGIETDKIDEIITAHVETTDALKEKVKSLEDSAKENADYKSKYDTIEKELNELKANNSGSFEKKYKAEQKAFADFKKEIEAEKNLTKKKELYKQVLKENSIADKAIESILNITDFSKINIDSDGNLENKDTIISDIDDKFSGFKTEKKKQGVNIPTPPTGGGKYASKDEIFAKDNKGRYKLSAEERQRAIAENADLF